MSDPWGMDCSAGEQAAQQCDVCIGEIVAIGADVLDALQGPLEPMLGGIADDALRVQRRLKRQAGALLAEIEGAITALGPLPPMQAPATAPSAADVTSPPPCDPNKLALDWSQEPHDVDQANLLLLADPTQPWHLRLRAWYGGALDSVLLAGDLQSAIAQREASAEADRAAHSDLAGQYASSLTLE